MKNLKLKILAIFLLFCTTHALAHVRWDPAGSVTERAPNYTSCAVPAGNSPTLFRSGSRVEVSFDVVITHGESYRIEFSPANDENFGDYLLKGNIPEVPGITYIHITLPNIECEACSLRVYGGGYVSCADIRLTATGLPEVDPQDTTAPNDISNLGTVTADKQVVLTWDNPADDFYEVLVLRSQSSIDTAPVNGTSYAGDDAIGDATVVYKGDKVTATATDLTMDTEYFFKLFAYDESVNYAPGIQQQITTTNIGNTAPTVELNVLQSVQLSLDVYRDRGEVMVQAIISDPDADDTHTIDWSETDSRLVDTDTNDTTFSFDPEPLEAGTYLVKLIVTDSGTPTFSSSAEITINVLESTATPMPTPTPTPAPTPAPAPTNTSGSSGGGGSLGATMFFTLLLLLLFRRQLSFKIVR